MTKMNREDIIAQEIIFNDLIRSLVHNIYYDTEERRGYIEEARSYLDDIKEDLEKAQIKIPRNRTLTKKVLEEFNWEKRITQKLIAKTAKEIEDAHEYLGKLADSPEEFYESKDAGKLLETCLKLGAVYCSIKS